MKNELVAIEKQVFEAEFISAENGLGFRRAYTDLIKQYLLSIIEEVLDEYSPENYVLKLNNLKVDIGSISYPFNVTEVKDMLLKALRAELNFKINKIFSEKEADAEDKYIAIHKREEELILFFLKEGYLPWWAPKPGKESLSITTLLAAILLNRPKTIIRILRAIKSDSNKLTRLVSYIDTHALLAAIFDEIGLPHTIIKQLSDYFIEIDSQLHAADLKTVFVQFMVSDLLVKKNKIKSAEELKRTFIWYLVEKNHVNVQQLEVLFSKSYMSNSKIRYSLKDHHVFEDYSLTSDKTILNYLFMNILDSDNSSISNLANHKSDTPDELRKEERKQLTEKAIIVEKIIVILLNYFLFGKRFMVDNPKDIKSVQALILYVHQNFPDKLRVLFKKIPSSALPYVVLRIEAEFENRISMLIFNQYLNETVIDVKENLYSYKTNCVINFLKMGFPSWNVLMSNNTLYIEQIIESFYESDPDYFYFLVKKYCKYEVSYFIEVVKEHYSKDFAVCIEYVLSREVNLFTKRKPEPMVSLSKLTLEEMVYYLSYFKRHKKFIQNITFSYKELSEFFSSRFPNESKWYFNFSENKERKSGALATIQIPEQKSKDPVYISNAGLILTHPFLMKFFERCDLIQDRKFKHKLSAHRAVHLLQYLVTKEENTEEHQLVLNKLLCGIPVYEPLHRNISLSDEEKEWCENLIRGIVENWSILKKTSNENFRVSFLQREGRISFNDTTRHIKVQESSYDVLLDRIPWSIAMIKLPWMEKILEVEWR